MADGARDDEHAQVVAAAVRRRKEETKSVGAIGQRRFDEDLVVAGTSTSMRPFHRYGRRIAARCSRIPGEVTDEKHCLQADADELLLARRGWSPTARDSTDCATGGSRGWGEPFRQSPVAISDDDLPAIRVPVSMSMLAGAATPAISSCLSTIVGGDVSPHLTAATRAGSCRPGTNEIPSRKRDTPREAERSRPARCCPAPRNRWFQRLPGQCPTGEI